MADNALVVADLHAIGRRFSVTSVPLKGISPMKGGRHVSSRAAVSFPDNIAARTSALLVLVPRYYRVGDSSARYTEVPVLGVHSAMLGRNALIRGDWVSQRVFRCMYNSAEIAFGCEIDPRACEEKYFLRKRDELRCGNRKEYRFHFHESNDCLVNVDSAFSFARMSSSYFSFYFILGIITSLPLCLTFSDTFDNSYKTIEDVYKVKRSLPCLKSRRGYQFSFAKLIITRHEIYF